MNKNATRNDFMQYAQYSDGLLQLEEQIKKYFAVNRKKRSYCAVTAWYRIFKRQVHKLVGWCSDDTRLQSSQAYDTVYGYLFNLLSNKSKSHGEGL